MSGSVGLGRWIGNGRAGNCRCWALEHGRVRGDTDYEPKPFAPIKVDRVVRDGETIQLGDVTLTAHLTPGHTPGCTSWSTTVRHQGRRLNALFLCSVISRMWSSARPERGRLSLILRRSHCWWRISARLSKPPSQPRDEMS
jgi:hypothetical protein